MFPPDEEPDNAYGLVCGKATEPFSESLAAYTNRDMYLPVALRGKYLLERKPLLDGCGVRNEQKLETP